MMLFDGCDGESSPVNVADIEDLAVEAGHFGVTSHKLDTDWRPAKVGTHGEVGDGSDHGDGGGDVVEDTVCAALGETHADEDHGGYGHHGSDSLSSRLVRGIIDVLDGTILPNTNPIHEW